MYKGKSVAIVIPCHNEGPRIQKVLKTVVKSKYADTVVVIDDASEDNSVAKILEFEAKVKLLRNKTNLGKTHSVFKAVKSVTQDITFLIDADLENLTLHHVDYCITKMIDLELDMLLLPVCPPGKLMNSACSIVGMNTLLTGQRLLKTNLLSALNLGTVRGYGLEMFLNKLAKDKKWKVDVIIFKKPDSYPVTPVKLKKYGLVNGLKKEIKMYSEILSEYTLVDYLQNVKFLIKKSAK